LFVSCP